MTAPGNTTYTRRANLVISLVRESGSWSGTTSDPHPPFGNEEGSTRLARIEIRFPEPSNWPREGRLVNARLKMRGRRDAHPNYLGGNPTVSVERINETPDRDHPSSTGGTAKTWAVSGWEVHDVSDMVEEMLPSRIRRRTDPELGCGNRPYGMFQIQSSDEANDDRSGVLADDFYLSVELKTSVTPGVPIIDSIVGAQVDDAGDVITDPVIVASTTGTVLDVTFTYVGGSGDSAAKVEMELRSTAATDPDPPTPAGGTIIKSLTAVPTKTGTTDQYRVRMSGIPAGTEGKFRLRCTSQKGVTGGWSSFDEDLAHVEVVALPGPPLDIVFQPYTEDPHVLFSLNSPDAADYITGGEVEATLLPQGTAAFDTGMQDVTVPGLRRIDIDSNMSFAPGQTISYRVRTRNRHQVIGQWSAPATVVVQETPTPSLSPEPGRLLDTEPTFTITDALFDGYRLKILDPVDDDTVIYDTGSQSVSDQTSVDVVIPAGKLTRGQKFRVVTSTLPDGETAYGTESKPLPYSIASLATVSLSVPDAVTGNVDTTTPDWLRTVNDPDGAATAEIEQEVRDAATPQGSGSLLVDDVDVTATPLYAVPGLTVDYESSVDARVRAMNDTGEYGPWSRWLTITALQPPDVDLITPLDTETINDPTGSHVWSMTGYGSRTQASAVLSIYSDAGVLVGSVVVDGSDNTAQVPAFLLDDGTDYLWDVTVTDTAGMETTSAQRAFTTVFAEPIPVDVVFAVADPVSGAVDVTWGDVVEPYLHNIEVTWLRDDGSPVRIDGGPESLGDDGEPFIGISVHHIGARLGTNVYHVAISNGNKASEPVTGSAVLRVADPAFPFLSVDGSGIVANLPVVSAAYGSGAIIERMQPPGGDARQVTWGPEAKSLSLSIQSLDSDPDLKTGLASLMYAGVGQWFKAPEGFHIEPLWGAIQRISPTPGAFGIVDTSIEVAELGDPVYAILPAVPEVPDDEGNIYSTVDALDFGTFAET